MRIAVTGATGLIGTHLVGSLARDGHDVVRLVRTSTGQPGDITWDPRAGTIERPGLTGVDAVVHLAGAPLAGRRWTASYKDEIRRSRVDGTTTIVRACREADPPPRVLVSGSAVGWYGDTGDAAVDESVPAGRGFLAEVVAEWEAAAQPAAEAGVRVATARTGIVIAAEGGLLANGVTLPGGLRVSLLDVFRLGLGGRLGSGRQWLSWISLDDEVAALRFLLARTDLHGPVNLTAPAPVRNRDFTRELARAVHRPAVLPVPGPALRLAAGGLAQDALASQRVLPRRLEAAGFAFRHPTLVAALDDVLG